MSKMSDAQRDALVRLAQAWAAGKPEPWDELRPQTREALRRAGLADGGILPAGLARIGLNGSGVIAWATQLRVAAQASRERDEHLRAWWRAVPRRHPYGDVVPVLTVADLRAAADALAPLEDAHSAAWREAMRLQAAARAEVRAAMGLADV